MSIATDIIIPSGCEINNSNNTHSIYIPAIIANSVFAIKL